MSGENLEKSVMTAKGKGAQNVSNARGTDVQPVWSPDGTKIAFGHELPTVRPFVDQGDIFIMNGDGSAQMNITGTVPPGLDFSDFQATWQPLP